jgi:hypothetical protein
MGYRESEMLKRFQHDSNIAKVSIFDYGLWTWTKLFSMLNADPKISISQGKQKVF